MQKAIDMVDAIGVRSWRGAGDELVSLLGHNDAVVRSHVAVRVAELEPVTKVIPGAATPTPPAFATVEMATPAV